ncbi:glycosyltransferase family 4 protein [Clostridium uliginosum]|uniref:1,2-diacylglycerol 3-alpha-glucosyltransferase n=1 Tax=Clostridium uliginosum TaxID=119641 RepID=A0A1I1RUQ6_9CLOT|nr:glycosyltransferase family 4 protein [Clostridium uliginosum]SFD34380.1 1,2-diacylglycerol 3-alpha-glucosyltransferase [Clostridium uliginosum]
MKILITTDTYSPMINGVVTSINNLYKELKYKGHDVKVLTLSHTGDERVDGDVYYLKSIKIGVYPDARIKVPLHNKLINEVVKWKPDVIHSQTEFSMMLVSKYIANKLNIPHIHTYHTMYENYLDYLLGGKIINKSTSAKITKILLNSLNGVIAPTEKTKNTLLSYGVNKPIYVVPTGIDLSRFQQEISLEEKQEIMSELQINQGDRIIAYVGRIAEEKNISEILTLLPCVIKEFKNIKLLIVGGGPYLNKLKNQVKEQNIKDNVIFTGMINAEEVYKYYKMAEIFVTASTSETQGLTYIEALSSGCPVVCKYDACIDGVIEQGKNGFSYKEKCEFTYYINKILRDTYLRDRMRKEAIIKANEYSSNIFANKVLDNYSGIIHANKEEIVQLLKLTNHKA